MTSLSKLTMMGYVAGLALVLALGVQQPARADTGDVLGGIAAGAILSNVFDGPQYHNAQYGYVPYGYREVCRWVWSGGRQVLRCNLVPDRNYGYRYYNPQGYRFYYDGRGFGFDYRRHPYGDPWRWNRQHNRWHRTHPRW